MKQIVLIHPGIFETRFHFQRLIKMLEREGFEVEIHKCWAKSNTKLKSDFDISHSGGYICPHYKAAKTKKIAFAPTTASSFAVLLEFIPKTIKDIKLYDFKFRTLKPILSLKEAIFNIFYWSGLIKSYLKINKEFKINDNELFVYHDNDGFSSLKNLSNPEKSVNQPGLHDEILNNPSMFKVLILNFLKNLS